MTLSSVTGSAEAMENVALGKRATSNDVYLTYAASNAVDGNPDTPWTASGHGSPDAPKWLKIDLGNSYFLDRIMLLFTYSGGQYEGYTNTYSLHLSEDDVTWTVVAEGTLIDTASLLQRSHTILPAGSARRARYVRYDVIGGSHWAQLFELSAYAPPTISHSLAGEWSDGTNPMPGGMWSIRSGDLPLLPVDDLGSTGIDTWDGPQPGFTGLGLATINDVAPSWFKAGSRFTGVASPTDWQEGDVVLHSGRAYHPPTHVCWRSPGDGIIAVSGAAWPVRDIGRHNLWRLLLNGRTLTEGVIGSGDAYSRNQPFHFADGSGGPAALKDLPIRAGEELRLAMIPAGGGIPDYAALDLTVTRTPSPTGGRHDFERDFSTGRNEAENVWSYRSGSARNGDYALMPFFHATGHEASGFQHFPAWHAVDDDDAMPHVGANVYPYPLTSNTGIIVEPGQSHLHPGAGGAVSVVTFRAPRSGTLLIDCGFIDLDAGGGDGVAWWVDRGDGTELASGRLVNGGDSGVLRLPPHFAQAGERVHFIIGAGGTTQNDTTRLRATVELVPADAPHTTIDFDGAFTNGVLLDSRGLEWSGIGDVAVTATPAKWGGAGSFDGDRDAFTPSAPTNDFSPGTDPFTVDFWMHPLRDGRGDYLLGKSRPDDGQGWDLRFDYGEILVTGVNGWQFNIGTDSVDDTRYIGINQWHHVALSCTETQARLFVDGRLRGECARGAIGETVNPFRIGSQENFGGRGFQGGLDEFRYWRQAVWTSEFTPPSHPGMGDTVLSASVPVLSVESAPGQLMLKWATRQGLEYGVETSVGLLEWSFYRPYAAPAGLEESEAIPIEAGTGNPRFYRVETRFTAP
jgi:hypothetical protein